MANKYFNSNTLQEFSISKAQYEECGHHYLKEHFCSNFLYGPKVGREQSRVSSNMEGSMPNKRIKIL